MGFKVYFKSKAINFYLLWIFRHLAVWGINSYSVYVVDDQQYTHS